jgi:hypothetical protein
MHFFLDVFSSIMFFAENFFQVFIRIDQSLENILEVGLNFLVNVMNVFKLSECVLTCMLFGVNFDAVGTHGEKTRLVFAEIDDKLFGVKGAIGWLHGKN